MFPYENKKDLGGITEIFTARTRLLRAFRHSAGLLNMQMAEAVLGFKPRKFISSYESIASAGYRSGSGELTAIINVAADNAETGLHGGGREYIRFYVDNGSGEWQDAGYTWIQVGSATGANNITGNKDGFITYEARLPFQPGPGAETINGPARLKAVLCWNFLPPANDPDCETDFPYIWGDVKETKIQICAGAGNIQVIQPKAAVPAPAARTSPLPACRKIVQSKPVINTHVKKTTGKNKTAVTGKVIPVYKLKNWRVAAL